MVPIVELVGAGMSAIVQAIPITEESGTRVIPGYTQPMKTAISIPDETFEKATRRAHDLGMSRSEFFSRAAARYLDELDAESLTRQIDLAVAALAGQDDSSADATAVGQRVLGDASGDW